MTVIFISAGLIHNDDRWSVGTIYYPLSPTPPLEGGGAFLPSPLQGEGPGERVFWLNLMAVTVSVGTHPRTLCVRNRRSGWSSIPTSERGNDQITLFMF